MTVPLVKPETYGVVPSCLFEKLLGNDAFYRCPVYLEDLPIEAHPLVETIAETVGKTLTSQTAVVVDQDVVKTRRPHRDHARHWHNDKPESFIVTNIVPTEYLVGELQPGARRWWDVLDNPTKGDYYELANSFGPRVIQEGIGLDIWAAKEGEIVKQQFSNIHRSPTNMTERAINRVFVAVIFADARQG